MAKLGKRIKNTFVYWFVVSMLLWVRLISRPTALHVFRQLGLLIFHLLRKEREKIIRHLTWVYGASKSEAEIRAMARQVCIDLGFNAVDAARLPLINPHNLDQLVVFEGLENIDKALHGGKGSIFITGHIGCWELMAAAVAMKGYPVYVIGKQLYDPRLDRILVRNRERSGYRNIARGGSSKKIFKALRSNAILGILIDQDTNVDGVFVNFFGIPAYTPIGPVVLATKSGASIVPIAIQMMPDFRHRILIKEPIVLTITGDRQQDLVVNTQKLSDFLEETIRACPTQWVWMHERWKTKPQVQSS